MDTEQAQWATQLREVPKTFRKALHTANEQAIQHHLGVGE